VDWRCASSRLGCHRLLHILVGIAEGLIKRVAVLRALNIILVVQKLKVSAIGRCGKCDAGTGVLRLQVAVGRHLQHLADVGVATALVGRHLVVHRAAVTVVAILVGLRLEPGVGHVAPEL